MSSPIPPSLDRFGDQLSQAALRELSTPSESRFARLRHPRSLFAGGTLGLAGVGAALVLAFSGSAAAPAFAITRDADGVLVHLSYAANQNLPQVNAKLAAMGTGEDITIYMAPGPAATPGPVTCQQAPGVSGPTVRVLNGANGTEVIAPGESGDNTAEGTFHLGRCVANSASSSGNSGNTGAS
jgi:hypothetical protein